MSTIHIKVIWTKQDNNPQTTSVEYKVLKCYMFIYVTVRPVIICRMLQGSNTGTYLF